MTWVAVNKDGTEWIFDIVPPIKDKKQGKWVINEDFNCLHPSCIYIPKGSIKKLIGKNITWSHQPVELVFEELLSSKK